VLVAGTYRLDWQFAGLWTAAADVVGGGKELVGDAAEEGPISRERDRKFFFSPSLAFSFVSAFLSTPPRRLDSRARLRRDDGKDSEARNLFPRSPASCLRRTYIYKIAWYGNARRGITNPWRAPDEDRRGGEEKTPAPHRRRAHAPSVAERTILFFFVAVVTVSSLSLSLVTRAHAHGNNLTSL